MRVLLTGASGYVGSRLVPALLQAGHEVTVGARDVAGIDRFAWADRVERRRLDVDDTVSVHLAVRDMDAVIYLVHSMGGADFVARDRRAARYVAHACEVGEVGRIVYLSGLVPEGELSDHLRSRLEVEQILREGAVPTTVLRASMVVGAGSASFEIMRRVSERLPLTTLPTWMRSRIQPISVEDVVALLLAALDGPPRDRTVDVGGTEVLSYAELLARFAEHAGLARPQVRVPAVPSFLVGEAVAYLSGLPRTTVLALVRSLSHDMLVGDGGAAADELLPGHRYLDLDEAIVRSLAGGASATESDGDIQGRATSDPDWVGPTGGSLPLPPLPAPLAAVSRWARLDRLPALPGAPRLPAKPSLRLWSSVPGALLAAVPSWWTRTP